MPTRFVTVELFSSDKMSGLPIKTVYSAMKSGLLKWALFGKRKLVDVKTYEEDCAASSIRIASTPPDLPELPPGGFEASLKNRQREIRLVKSKT